MKMSAQTHDQSLESNAQAHKQTLQKHAAGIYQSKVPVPGDASATQPAAADAENGDAKKGKRFSNPYEMRSAMQSVMDDGYVFASSLCECDVTFYRYKHPTMPDILFIWEPVVRAARAAVGTPVMYALRHGSTTLNEDNKFRGWLNPDLDNQGIADARDAAKFLKDKGIKRIFCSDLSRARETAQIVAKELGITVVTPDEALRPWNIGELAGKDKDEKPGYAGPLR